MTIVPLMARWLLCPGQCCWWLFSLHNYSGRRRRVLKWTPFFFVVLVCRFCTLDPDWFAAPLLSAHHMLGQWTGTSSDKWFGMLGLTTEYRATFHIVLPSQWLVGLSVVKDITDWPASHSFYVPSLTDKPPSHTFYITSWLPSHRATLYSITSVCCLVL